ncbi:UNVERIFIED_CONTAM: histidine kinase [Acetivibrio alkalicellulosi]
MKLQTKMILIFSALIMIMALILSMYIYTESIELITESLGVKTVGILDVVIEKIETDDLQIVIDKVKKVQESNGDMSDILTMEEYVSLRQKLFDFRDVYGIKYLYIMTRGHDDELIYVVDGFPLDYKGKDISMPGDVEKNNYEYLELTFEEKKSFIGEMTKDAKWGANYTSYTPIFNDKNEMIGALGVDVEAEDVFELMTKNKHKVISFTILAVVLTILVSWIFSRVIFAPLKNLALKVRKVKEGDLSARFDRESNDEIGELADVFNNMVSVFYDNEQSLYKTLVDLSKSRTIKDLEKKIVENIKHTVSFSGAEILVFDGEKFLSDVKDLNVKDNEIIETLQQIAYNKRIGDIIEYDDKHLSLIGLVNGKYSFLLMNTKGIELSQRDKFTIRLISRYTAIFYENLLLIEELSNKIMNYQNEGSVPPWMSKLYLQMSEKERKRLASDLHDELLQDIIKMKRSVANLLNNESFYKDDNIKALKSLEDEFDSVIALIRETCNDLLPSFLLEKGVVRAIERLIEKAQLKHNININFESINIRTKIESLEYEEVLTVYRVVQELINNAVAHSKATDVDIMLRQDKDMFSIYYNDNGVGMEFEAEVDLSKHLGFYGIKERIKLLNGRVACYSKAGKGLEVSCQFPIKRNIA